MTVGHQVPVIVPGGLVALVYQEEPAEEYKYESQRYEEHDRREYYET